MKTLFSYVSNWKNNPHAALAIYGAATAEILKIWLPHYAEQLAGTQKVLTWYGILAASNTGGPSQGGLAAPGLPPEQSTLTNPGIVSGKGNTLGKMLPSFALLILSCFCFTGCVSSIRASGEGKVCVTVTEKVFGVVIGNSVLPFSFDVTETSATGNYQTGNDCATNHSISSQPIVPK